MYICMCRRCETSGSVSTGPSGRTVWRGGAGDSSEGQPNRVGRPVRIGGHLAHILDVHQDARYVCT